ncbi:extracellular tyrosine-protein kinase PKDCC-like [Liolophura sinensis]|uniref:extracellular tyrosine-protein kinase PKDCC-like n=1 Tax=Liolophura sinensis TaxID=3198878 RepID=UPI0031588E3A
MKGNLELLRETASPMFLCTNRYSYIMRVTLRRLARYMLLTLPVCGYLAVVYVFNYEPCYRLENNNNGYKRIAKPVSVVLQERNYISRDQRANSNRGDSLTDNLWNSRRLINSSPSKRLSRKISQDANFPEFVDSSDSRPVEDTHTALEGHLNSKEFDAMLEGVQNPYYFDCSNIHLIRLRKKVGEGVSKQTYLGDYNGHQVAVKMVTRHQADVRKCLMDLKQTMSESGQLSPGSEPPQSDRAKCYIFPTMKLMKETLILQQLNHPGIVKLLGFCVRSEESEASDLSEHGVIVIEEYASRFMISGLQVLPWQKRLKHARDLASLLYYLEHSPLGSLKVPDFKEPHFLMKNGTIKLTDFDDVSNLEPPCAASYVRSRDGSSGHKSSRSTCEFDLPCQMAMCVGRNAKINLKNTRKLFFKRLLLPGSFPEEIADDIAALNIKLDNLSTDAEELYVRLTHLLETPVLEDIDR